MGRKLQDTFDYHTSYHLPMKMEQIECSKMSAYIIQTPENNPKENIIFS